ncbi:aminodeoxychorismate synthase subunit I /aminodeoxychorismate lyase apoprotein [Ureibacillus xyleni]|uniref:Aminodeoxychorismate synthase subunit I /aminodeoxychorismate lyase apoprotein n=1 Tax=Ureibacillus xyleni TaxID=614648 RepID=A0A285TV82_9BACL|nr:aminodeoxychorismate synthase component I [Ureibacillus xyleni]SOC25615.1 aminodeoxychorismate synthase subunit I /aminodeoxychorismate lyase apoprotein [Ureibacillus xyleni]
MKQQSPILSFDFPSKSGVVEPLTFQNPIKLIIANNIEEVLPCFQLIEEALQNGFYVAGYLSYESAPAFDAAYKVKNESQMPLLWFGVFHEPETIALHSTGEYSLSEWVPSVDKKDYHKAITSIKQLIEDGVTYQTNYTIRLHSQFHGDDIALYEKLKRAQVSNYCAYVNTGDFQVLSASPELFFKLHHDQLTTRPMKGTLKRGKTLKDDEKNRMVLYHSEKNRAENVMIVDLLRNDLSVVAKPGTVKVEKLFEIEDYPTVHQMTSTITATIWENKQFVDIFKALFPCGSITGAPKISTMEAIEKLETTPREVYCGAIGYITPNREAIFNVPIRTVIINQKTGEATYGVGGGITWDSTTEDEYHEVLAKASLLTEKRPEFQLLESLLLQDGEYFLLEEHLTRILSSAKYFGYKFNLDAIRLALINCAERNKHGDYKIRLLVDQTGETTLECQLLKKQNSGQLVTLADLPVNKNNLFLYHKTTNREVYSQYQTKFRDFFDVLLWNEEEEITEFTNGNVVLEIDGGFWTPPVKSGLLAGTYRDRLLKEGRICERTLKLEDLNQCSNIWFINSVRKWIKVQLG